MPVAHTLKGAARLFLAMAVVATVVTAGRPSQADSAAMVLNAATGEVLYSYHADEKLRPASLTKIMTLYLAFEALKSGEVRPDQELKVSRRATWQRPSRLGLRRGRTITVEQAVLALVTKSANDVAVVVAEGLAGSEPAFARKMTARALSLGMRDTRFANASGLHHADQYTTARDMATLALAMIEEFPQRYRYFSTSSFSWRGRKYPNHNALLATYDGMDGIKTGYTRQSGYNLVASAERNGQRVIGIVLGSESSDHRDWRMETLLDYGFDRIQDVDGMRAAPIPLPYIIHDDADQAMTVALDAGADAERYTLVRQAALSGGSAAAVSHEDFLGRQGNTVSTAEGDADDDDAIWGIQVGAYQDVEPAAAATAHAVERVPSILGGTTAAVVPVSQGETRLYRARLLGLNEKAAREACRRLSRQEIPCVAVPGQTPD